MAAAVNRDLYQELRLALVYNGGVSLAEGMGGAAKEIDRFRTAFSRLGTDLSPAVPAHAELLDVLETVVVTDVIAGASAGGINGALLAYVVGRGKSLECAGPNEIRSTWQKLGSMQNLLYTDGKPKSLLRTNEVLFGGAAEVFGKLRDAATDLSDATSRWVRLAVTATDTQGYWIPAPAGDGEVAGRDHRLLFRFRQIVYPKGDKLLLSQELRDAVREAVGPQDVGMWPFGVKTSSGDIGGDASAALLTRAARTTSSFPFAFAPSELPLDYTTDPVIEGPEGQLTATPAMAEVLQEALTGKAPTTDPDEQGRRRRYAIDGGVWDNTPFSAVLRAVERTPSVRDVRRVLVYLVGTREPAHPNTVDEPSLASSLRKSIALPADVSFANDLDRIADDLERQWRRRDNVLRLLGGDASSRAPDLFELAAQLYPLYRANLQGRQALVPPGDELPGADASLEDWWATPATWGWGPEPARFAIQATRRLLRALLRAVSQADGTVGDEAVKELLDGRRLLSQLAWVLDDLVAARDDDTVTSDQAARISGQVMHDFAAEVAGLNAAAAAAAAAVPGNTPLGDALRATETVTAGGADMVVRRALALAVTMTALGGSTTEFIDYTFATIRPDRRWPDQVSVVEGDERPPLAGASLHHFGGFFRSSWRLHDWMWGRIDAVQTIVGLLLTGAQLDRLTNHGDPARVSSLAGKLAKVAIPDAADDGGYVTSRRLALRAFASWSLDPGGPDGPEPAAGADEGGRAGLIEKWRAALAAKYEAAIPDIVQRTIAAKKRDQHPDDLDRLCGDARARFRFAIVGEELRDVLDACPENEGPIAGPDGPFPGVDELLADPDAALARLVPTVLCEAPGRHELVLDGENAAANLFYALGLDPEGLAARELAKVTKAKDAIDHALAFAGHYLKRVKFWE
jgi:predicted acylesterase/phospholipase RssA